LKFEEKNVEISKADSIRKSLKNNEKLVLSAFDVNDEE